MFLLNVAELTDAVELSGSILADYLSLYSEGLMVEDLVTYAATTIYNALTELGPGSCLLQDEVVLIDNTLLAIPNLYVFL